MRADPRQLDAIAGLYAAFARYPQRALEACACCASSEDLARLARLPLRRLSERHLSTYAVKALTTWGDEDDFKHFLPRLFELAIDADAWPLDLDHLAIKLEYSDWRRWPEHERAAVAELFAAAFHGAAESDPTAPAARDTMAILDRVEALGLDPEPLLATTFESLRGRALTHLVRLAEKGLGLSRRKPPRWSTWLRADALRAHVERAAALPASAEEREQLSYLAMLLDMLRERAA
jgi:hypothetical protein